MYTSLLSGACSAAEMIIDPHVHCRDWKEAQKETIAHALSVAERGGLTAIIDMTNTAPPVLIPRTAWRRILAARQAQSPVHYFLYVVLTDNKNQITQAVRAYNELEEVVGLKMYGGPSTNNAGMANKSSRLRVFEVLARENYDGVLAVHCEHPAFMKASLFKKDEPWTHCSARPPEAEVQGVQEVIEFAGQTGFRGIIHIAHISVPESVYLVRHARHAGLRTTCGVTPHHLLLDDAYLRRGNGLLYKMNPPLRDKSMVAEMQRLLKIGMIDWIETDHAPHTLDDKVKNAASGIPGLAVWPHVLRWLQSQGYTQEQIQMLTFKNANKTFGLNLTPRACPEVAYDLAKEYPFDPYADVF